MDVASSLTIIAVGALHSSGVRTRIRSVAAYPVFCTTSSRPYGPPATMK
jgi:hypothetical protein